MSDHFDIALERKLEGNGDQADNGLIDVRRIELITGSGRRRRGSSDDKARIVVESDRRARAERRSAKIKVRKILDTTYRHAHAAGVGFGSDREPFFAVNSIDLLVIGPPAFPLQQDMQTPVAIADARFRKLLQAKPKRHRWIAARRIAVRSPTETGCRAGMAPHSSLKWNVPEFSQSIRTSFKGQDYVDPAPWNVPDLM